MWATLYLILSFSSSDSFSSSVVRQCKNVELSFSDVTSKTDILKGTKKGTIYLTPYRVQTTSYTKNKLNFFDLEFHLVILFASCLL